MRKRKYSPPNEWTPQALADALAIYQAADGSLQGLAKALGCPVYHARSAVILAGGEIRPHAAWPPERRKLAADLYAVHQSLIPVALIMRCAWQDVKKSVLLHGGKIRSRAHHGEANHAWKGGRNLDADGYVRIHRPSHPMATKAGYVLEHRLVMEAMIGRILERSEVVHHRDNDKQNNTPGNLELFDSNAAHLAATLKGQCPKWTEDGRARLAASCVKRRKPKDSPPLSASDDEA